MRKSTLIDDSRIELSYTKIMASKKATRGGYRPGSGRKPILKDPKSIKVSLDRATYDRLAEAAEERETSIGSLVREAVGAYFSKRRSRK